MRNKLESGASQILEWKCENLVSPGHLGADSRSGTSAESRCFSMWFWCCDGCILLCKYGRKRMGIAGGEVPLRVFSSQTQEAVAHSSSMNSVSF